MEASYNGHTEVVQLLLGKGAAVDEKAKDGRTALVQAGRNSHTEVVQLLLDKGAAVDVKDTYGRTAVTAFANPVVKAPRIKPCAARTPHRAISKLTKRNAEA